MVEFPSVDWASLRQAYGSAEDIPTLLEQVKTDTRAGHVSGSTWFALWSALCHQGNIYTASYAAVPFLVRIAEQCDGTGPDFPTDLLLPYRAALARGLELATAALEQPLDTDSRRAYQFCIAVFHGQMLTAENILGEGGIEVELPRFRGH